MSAVMNSSVFWWLVIGRLAHIYVVVECREGVADDKPISQQVKDLEDAGYYPAQLDNHTQLKVFLYTWLGMENAEGG